MNSIVRTVGIDRSKDHPDQFKVRLITTYPGFGMRSTCKTYAGEITLKPGDQRQFDFYDDEE